MRRVQLGSSNQISIGIRSRLSRSRGARLNLPRPKAEAFGSSTDRLAFISRRRSSKHRFHY